MFCLQRRSFIWAALQICAVSCISTLCPPSLLPHHSPTAETLAAARAGVGSQRRSMLVKPALPTELCQSPKLDFF